MGEGGFEPPKPKQQIYSLPHLTALELSQILRAGGRTWTPAADYKSAALPTELHQRVSFLFENAWLLYHDFSGMSTPIYNFFKKFSAARHIT